MQLKQCLEASKCQQAPRTCQQFLRRLLRAGRLQGVSTQGERDVLARFNHLGARMAEQKAAVDEEEVAADVAAAVRILIPSRSAW